MEALLLFLRVTGAGILPQNQITKKKDNNPVERKEV